MNGSRNTGEPGAGKDDRDDSKQQELQPDLPFLGMNELRHESHESNRHLGIEDIYQKPSSEGSVDTPVAGYAD